MIRRLFLVLSTAAGFGFGYLAVDEPTNQWCGTAFGRAIVVQTDAGVMEVGLWRGYTGATPPRTVALDYHGFGLFCGPLAKRYTNPRSGERFSVSIVGSATPAQPGWVDMVSVVFPRTGERLAQQPRGKRRHGGLDVCE